MDIKIVFLTIFLLILQISLKIEGQCHSNCNKNGLCNKKSVCECFPGWEGADCSRRTCPSGNAWVDIAYAPNQAHGSAVCSNMGICNYGTGVCTCRKGFTGLACERFECGPQHCSGHGTCYTMKQAGALYDGYHLNRTFEYNKPWDAKRIYGCVCDPGYEGYDCSQRECPRSDDPRTPGGQDEVATLYCQCDICSGTFKLRYMAEATAAIRWNDDADTLASKLMALDEIYGDGQIFGDRPPVMVNMSGNDTVCSRVGTTSQIRFTRNTGDLPPLSLFRTQKLNGTIYFQTEQTLTCMCGPECEGIFQIKFDHYVTDHIAFDADAGTLVAALEDLPNLVPGSVSAIIQNGDTAICRNLANVTTVVTVNESYGNIPAFTVLPSLLSANGTADLVLTTNDGTKEAEPCGGIGRCQKNGSCHCPFDWTFDGDYAPCGRRKFNTSSWAGVQTCPGIVDEDFEELWPPDINPSYVWFVDAGFSDNGTYEGLYKFELDTFLGTAEMPVAKTNFSISGGAGLALDLTMKYAYWLDTASLSILKVSISEIDINCTVKEVVSGLQSEPYDLELDLRFDNRQLYWSEPGLPGVEDGSIYRVNLDGEPVVENLTDLIGVPLIDPHGLALDLTLERLYWVDSNMSSPSNEQTGKVYCWSIDGSYTELVYALNLTQPRGIALDVLDQIMYITDTEAGTITNASYQVNFTDYEWNDTASFIYDQQVNPEFIHLTQLRDALYWSSSKTGAGTIMYGLYEDDEWGDDTELFTADKGTPMGIAVDQGLGMPKTTYYDCWGHGYCNGAEGRFKCICDEGWEGDCQYTTCPKGPAWFDQAYGTNLAHYEAECSNRGVCNRKTGLCMCDKMFNGAACERMRCAEDIDGRECHGIGRCLSMSQLAELNTDSQGTPDPKDYGTITNSTITWDAEVIHGCSCDTYGYLESYHHLRDATNYMCTHFDCPLGDNYRTHLHNSSQFEIQNLTCTAVGFDHNDTFTLSFRGETTSPIAGNTTASELESILEGLTTIGDVNVWSWPEDGFVCTQAGSNFRIEFLTELGDVPELIVDAVNLAGTIHLYEQQKGNKDNIECSDHGHCNFLTGDCECVLFYISSDGDGNLGTRGDCGYRDENCVEGLDYNDEFGVEV